MPAPPAGEGGPLSVDPQRKLNSASVPMPQHRQTHRPLIPTPHQAHILRSLPRAARRGDVVATGDTDDLSELARFAKNVSVAPIR